MYVMFRQKYLLTTHFVQYYDTGVLPLKFHEFNMPAFKINQLTWQFVKQLSQCQLSWQKYLFAELHLTFGIVMRSSKIYSLLYETFHINQLSSRDTGEMNYVLRLTIN